MPQDVSKRRVVKPKRFSNSKFSFAVLSSRRHRNIRRAFRSFSTEEAWTFVVRFKGKLRFCRVDRGKNAQYLAEHRRLVLDLFHRLYPKNSITPIGILKIPASAIVSAYPEEFAQDGTSGVSDWLHEHWQKQMDNKRRGLVRFPVFGVVTEIQKGQSPDFKIYQREVRGEVASFSQASKRHMNFIERVGLPVANRIFRESGIRVDYAGNVSNVEGNPLFFEPKITAPSRLVDFIKIKPKREREELMRIARKLGIA